MTRQYRSSERFSLSKPLGSHSTQTVLTVYWHSGAAYYLLALCMFVVALLANLVREVSYSLFRLRALEIETVSSFGTQSQTPSESNNFHLSNFAQVDKFQPPTKPSDLCDGRGVQPPHPEPSRAVSRSERQHVQPDTDFDGGSTRRRRKHTLGTVYNYDRHRN